MNTIEIWDEIRSHYNRLVVKGSLEDKAELIMDINDFWAKVKYPKFPFMYRERIIMLHCLNVPIEDSLTDLLIKQDNSIHAMVAYSLCFPSNHTVRDYYNVLRLGNSITILNIKPEIYALEDVDAFYLYHILYARVSDRYEYLTKWEDVALRLHYQLYDKLRVRDMYEAMMNGKLKLLLSDTGKIICKV